MLILNVLDRIFYFIFPISIFTTLIIQTIENLLKPSKNNAKINAPNNSSQKFTWKNHIESAISISAILIIAAPVLLIWIKRIQNLYWLIAIISIPICIKGIVTFCHAIGIIKKVVISNDIGKLSSIEWTAINVLAYTIWFLNIQNIFKILLKELHETTNVYISDMLIALSHIILFSLYIFILCALLSELLINIIGVLKKLYIKLLLKNKITDFEQYWINKIEETPKLKSTLIFQWELIGRQPYFIHWIRYILLPITFIFDSFLALINISLSSISSSIGLLSLLIRMLRKALKQMLNWLLNLSDKRIIAISFRISLIMALVCTVVFNRYQPIFRMQEASTAVLEFIASAIIIPIIFEWISSFKNNLVNNAKAS